jgi:hypothetical protein
MARVYIDVCAWGSEWLRAVLSEISSSQNVIFVESQDWKTSKEKQRQFQLMGFLKNVQDRYGRHRVEMAPKTQVEVFIDKILGCAEWNGCEACDDPHIFALVKVKGVRFVITSEKRMDTCRSKMHGHLDREALKFRLVNSARNYKAHRNALIS